MKIASGFLLAFAIGVVCRLVNVPLPAPPVLLGTLLVFTMTLGYAVTDGAVARRAARHRAPSGGPTGETAAPQEKTE